MIKYKAIRNKNEYTSLTIEGDILLSNILAKFFEKYSGKGMLIIRADSDERETYEVMSKSLESKSIAFENVDDHIWIEPENVLKVLRNTDFGQSQDSCFMLSNKPPHSNLTNNYRSKIFRYQESLLSTFIKDETDVFFSCILPDINVISKSAMVIDYLNENLEEF